MRFAVLVAYADSTWDEASPEEQQAYFEAHHDVLGITKEFKPRFLRRYAELHDVMTQAVQHYVADVKNREFPSKEEGY